MKKIFSFFTLLVFIIVLFFQNSMMSFAMEKMSMDMKMEIGRISECCDEKEYKKDNCNHECCYQSERVLNINILNNTRESNKKVKIKAKNFIDIFSFSLNLQEDKKLTKITSPPYENRYIKNYSYINLTKIIKSNT